MEAAEVVRFMNRALELAELGRYGASPNPMVGAVVLDSQDNLVGEGYHACCGGPHAEVVALEMAGARASGGTLLVTLEPCSHFGRTPPCVQAVLRSSVAEVVVAMRDPNSRSAGGLEQLERAGVKTRLLADELTARARRLNRRWLRRVEADRPWVTLKAATTLDGRIATSSGQSRWITGETARRRSLELREEHDAILVGVGTVLADNPHLTRRLGLNPGTRWLRVVLDSRLRTPPNAHVVTESPRQTLIAHTASAPASRRRELGGAGVRLVELPAAGGGRVDLPALLRHLAAEEVIALLVEGGSAVHGAFVDSNLVDEVIFFVAPVLLGGAALPVVGGRGAATLEAARRLLLESTERRGDDLELRAVVTEEGDVHRVG